MLYDTVIKRGHTLKRFYKEKRTLYHIQQYRELLDSSNMNMTHWIMIAKDIQKYYNDFDGFVVLHGTDTMAYTASGLSFMLENLTKPVIVTGSQVVWPYNTLVICATHVASVVIICKSCILLEQFQHN